MTTIHVVGTSDTKAAELLYLCDLLRQNGANVVLVDIGTGTAGCAVDVSSRTVAAFHPDGADAVLSGKDRGNAVAGMGTAFAAYCTAHVSEIQAIIGIGGGGGTSMVCAGLRMLPYGVPKVMVSTLASGDVAPYVGTSDIVMVPSVTDLAGLNRLSRQILHNAAYSIAGMAERPYQAPAQSKPSVGLTMFGVTTPCVTRLTRMIEDRFDCVVFHATGTGGRSMEQLLREGMLQGLLDITTTEIADELVGGVLSAGPTRLDAVAETGSPYVASVGALDMVNFWAPETVPERFKDRLFYHHNPNVTLMRTTVAECEKIGHWIGDKLNHCDGPIRLLLPEKGISALDIDEGPFCDPQARDALFTALRDTIRETSARKIISLPYHINDDAFADAAAETFADLMRDKIERT